MDTGKAIVRMPTMHAMPETSFPTEVLGISETRECVGHDRGRPELTVSVACGGKGSDDEPETGWNGYENATVFLVFQVIDHGREDHHVDHNEE